MSLHVSGNFRWRKLGNIVEPAELGIPAWINDYIQAPNCIVYEDFVRVFFCTREPRDENGQYVSRVGFFDTGFGNNFRDKTFSSSPIIELGSVGSFDEFGTYPFSPIRHDGEVIAAYAGWTRPEATPFDVSIGMAREISPGSHFARMGPGPIVTKSLNEPFVISSPKLRYFNDQFYLFYIAGNEWVTTNSVPDPIYTIKLAISKDGESWEKVGRDLIPKVITQEAQASPDVIYIDGTYHMFFCYRHGTDFRDNNRGYRMGYAFSKDLINWVRDDSKSNLKTSDQGWDSESVSYPHVFKFKGATYMMYLGNGIGKTGIGIAMLEDK